MVAHIGKKYLIAFSKLRKFTKKGLRIYKFGTAKILIRKFSFYTSKCMLASLRIYRSTVAEIFAETFQRNS
jgi:hypothetical protein